MNICSLLIMLGYDEKQIEYSVSNRNLKNYYFIEQYVSVCARKVCFV